MISVTLDPDNLRTVLMEAWRRVLEQEGKGAKQEIIE